MAMIVTLALILSGSVSVVRADVAKSNPLGKVIELMSSLEVKIVEEGEQEAAAFNDFFQWCDKASSNLNHEINTYTKTKEKQEAKIAEFASDIEVAVSKIEDLSGAVAKNEAELKEETRIRSKESADFVASEKELVETIDTISRAISIISDEMSKNPAALAQIDSTNMASLMQSLSLVVDAAGFSSADQKKLVALVQAHQGDEDMGAPASASYGTQSGGIVDVLEDLKDKAESELSDSRDTEKKSQHNFDMLRQSLEAQMAEDTKDLNQQKSAKEDAEDEKAKTEGDLAITIPDLKDDKASLDTFHQDCMQSAADHEATMGARKEELHVISEAKTILREASYGPLKKDDKMCECISQSCSTGTFEAEIQKHKDADDEWGSWCFTRGNCNSLNQQSVEECPGQYWARLEEGAFEPARTSKADHTVSDEVLEKEDNMCTCISKSCSTGTFEAEIQKHDDANPDWGSWCFTQGNCNSLNQKSMEECPGSYWARQSEGAVEPQAASLVQLASTSSSTMQTRADLANSEVLAMVKKLAHEHHSAALAQLASQIAVVAKYGRQDGANPFDKIKQMVSSMLDKLQREAQSEATEQAYCKEQIAETEAKKQELDFDTEKLVAKIDQAVASKTELKDETRALHEEVSLLSKTIADLLQVRSTQHANYLVAKADITQGLAAVQKALDLLRNYYGTAASMIQENAGSGAFLQQPAKPEQHAKSGGAGGAVIDILEVCESDFANGLSKEETEEADAEAQHQQILQDKKICKTTKESDLKYKTKEIVGLEKAITELASDKETKDSELSAVLQYFAKVQERCVAKPEGYAARTARREAELSGLQEVLSTLKSEAAFIQKKGRRMRGGFVAMQ